MDLRKDIFLQSIPDFGFRNHEGPLNREDSHPLFSVACPCHIQKSLVDELEVAINFQRLNLCYMVILDLEGDMHFAVPTIRKIRDAAFQARIFQRARPSLYQPQR